MNDALTEQFVGLSKIVVSQAYEFSASSTDY